MCAELVGFNEHTRAGPPDSTGSRQPVAEVEAAGTTHLVQFLLNLTSINSRTTSLLCAFVMYSLGVCVVAEAESG